LVLIGGGGVQGQRWGKLHTTASKKNGGLTED
jgi:hypothetical protein